MLSLQKLSILEIPMAGLGDLEVPDLNDEFVPSTAIEARPPPRRYQPRRSPHSLHIILHTLATLMASIATVIELMMPLFHRDTSFLLNSMDDYDVTRLEMAKSLLYSHIVPCFLQVIGLIHI